MSGSQRALYIAGGVIAGIIALTVLDGLVAWIVFAVLVGLPVAAWLTLDKSQRRRIRNINRRRLP
ncbi:hypothetical protein [Yinghuangia soli]|uniref:Uncharacterized protein n=1 Tax=Yinghuangia soli TaxID=2908204 RepID=A0AA41TYW9_9ACTN|nr:hypothetical protein [Yinghuangia soli]MCF2526876.1 hypothetical protein [Yinghuangia soli]